MASTVEVPERQRAARHPSLEKTIPKPSARCGARQTAASPETALRQLLAGNAAFDDFGESRCSRRDLAFVKRPS